MRSIKLLIFLVMLGFQLKAQPYFDAASFKLTGSPNYGLFRRQYYENNFSHILLQANVPVNLKNKNQKFVFSAFYENWSIYSEQYLNTTYAKSIGLPITYITPLNDRWMLNLCFIPRVNARYFDLPGSFQAGGYFLLTQTLNPKLKLRYGIYYNREAFGNFILPLLGVIYKPNDRVYLWGTLPQSLNYQYKLTKSLFVGANMRGITNSYQQISDSFVQINDVQLGLFTDWYLTKSLVLNMEVGHSFFRKIRYGVSGEFKDYKPVVDYNDNVNLRIGFAYRVQL